MLPSQIEELSEYPSVTILLASYDRLEFLKFSVESALTQQYENFEIIIVDDGSKKDVVEWLQLLEIKQEKVTVFYQTHQGVASARAYGVEKAKTDLICILDSDDILVQNAIRKMVSTFKSRPDIQIVFTDIREIKSNGEEQIRKYSQFESAATMIRVTLIKPRLPFKHSGTMFRRQTALNLGSYNKRLPCKVDIDLYLKFLKAGFIPEHINEPLVNFRMHKNSISLNRFLGIKVWMYLIDLYGPDNPFLRFTFKLIRASAELAKRVYIEIRVSEEKKA